MRSSTTLSVLAAAALAVALTVAGCGSSGEKAAETTSAAPESTETTPETAAMDDQTVGEYLTANGVSQTIVKANEPGVPMVDLPMPDGWESIPENDLPQDAYGAIVLSAVKDSPNPPVIIARMARLEGGTFEVAKILELSPNAVTRLQGWDGPTTGTPSDLDGSAAVDIAGNATIDDAPGFVARKSVVIEGPQNTYILALDAQGPADQAPVMLEAMGVIDDGTTINPAP